MFSLTPKQHEAQRVLGSSAPHILLFGGSRSGKTFLILRTIATRAIAAPMSRHAVLRQRFNHVKAAIVHDTWPKMLELCFPGVEARLDRTDWYATFPNGSEVWFGGLDEKERTEKILGQEFATIFLNEVSHISYESRNIAVTRLAQRCKYQVSGKEVELRRKMYYDCNPPSKAHWTYKLFMLHRDPDSNQNVLSHDYASLGMNPRDNIEHLGGDYLKTLESLPPRMRARFLEGVFAETASGVLWKFETIDCWRSMNPPDMLRIVVAVDPSGASNQNNEGNDDIGIVVCGLGTDGNGYVLEDLTLCSGPDIWGKVAVNAFDRLMADLIVAETNFGGDMVRFVVQAAKPRVPFKKVTASRGKVVRAEPISVLTEQGKIRFAGSFPQLEDELCSFTTAGYIGTGSPNRADAMIWGMSELFPGIIKEVKPKGRSELHYVTAGSGSWMTG